MYFQKKSPILPFFNHAYNKLRQSGALWRINQNWADKSIGKCETDPLEPISFNKIVSLVALLLLGICSSLVILLLEILVKKGLKQEQNSFHNHSGLHPVLYPQSHILKSNNISIPTS